MGFFDKVKNAITGGGADVSLEAGPVTPGQPFEVRIRAVVSDSDLETEGVYLDIRGIEAIEVPDVDVVYGSGDNEERVTETVTAETRTFSARIDVTGGDTLAANQEFNWTARAELPADSLPKYAGTHCTHRYEARASLDCFGNDPDSGWVELDVQ
jgi:hypothetical protein